MQSEGDEIAIRLSQNSRLQSKGYGVTGMVVFVSCVIGLAKPPKGEASDLFFPGVALLSFAITKWDERLSAREFAVLYNDRFEEPALGGSNKVVHWKSVDSLRWVSGSDATLIVTTKEVETPLGFFPMNMEYLDADDRLTFIRYVRRVAEHVPQERWPSFCRRVAVPLAENIDSCARDAHDADEQPRTLREKIVRSGIGFIESHPFFAGLLMPVSCLLTLPLLVSKKVAWTLAAIVGASCAINVRLVWGAWIQPFTTIMFGAAAAFGVLGIFSLPRGQESVQSSNRSSDLAILGYLLAMLIGLPFAMNALLKGWLPKDMALVVQWLARALFLLPLVLIPWIQIRREERSKAELESEAVAAWDERERRFDDEFGQL